jgi:ATP-dependent metalloprotease
MYSLTILPRGQSLGHTSFVPEKEIFLQTKDMFEAQLDVSLGGRVAEELIFGNKNITTGCGSDLRQTTQIAYGIARSLAMRDNIMITMEKNKLSDQMNYIIDQESQKIIQVF